MKKILLSCATCLLALGLVTACDNEEEEPNEPGTVVDDGGSELATIKSGKLGLLYEENYHYLYFTGEVTDGFKGTLSENWSDGVSVTLAGTADSCYLSFEQNGSTVYVGGYTQDNYFDMDVESTPYALKYDSTNDAILTTDGKYYLGAYNGEYLRWMSSNYLGNEGDYTAHIYSSAQTNPTAPVLPDPAEWEVGGTYLFGVNTGSAIQYIDGTTPSGYTYEGNLTTNLTYAVPVTIGEYTDDSGAEPVDGGDDDEGDDDNQDVTEEGLPAYTLSFELEGETYYITITVSTSGQNTYYNLAYSTEEAPIYWDDTNGYWVDETGAYFLCYNSYYKCLYCSAIADYGTSPAAATYEYSELPAPTSMTIAGASAVYIGYTIKLSVEVEEGASASVTWAITDADGSETNAATIDEYGTVEGVSEAEVLIVTATSTIAGGASATHILNVAELETPDVSTDPKYKLGCLDEANYRYVWFSGNTKTSSSSTFLETTEQWDSAAEVYITGLASYGIDNSCTLSIYDSDAQSLKYISCNGSTSITLEESPCVWVWNDVRGCFAQGSEDGRYICFYSTGSDFRAYAQSNTNEPVTAFSNNNKPEDPVRPAPESITISGPTEVCVGRSITLEAVVAPEDAIQTVTWSTEDSDHITVDQDTGVVTGVAVTDENSPVTVTATSTENESVTATYAITVTSTFSYSYTFTGAGSGSAKISTEGGAATLNGLEWTTTTATYIGGSASNGLQVGSSSSAQTTAWTISTDFEQEVEFKSVVVVVGAASDSSGATCTVSIGDTALDENGVSFGAGDPTTISHTDDLSNTSGQKLSISLVCTEKAMYLKSIEFVVEYPDTGDDIQPQYYL